LFTGVIFLVNYTGTFLWCSSATEQAVHSQINSLNIIAVFQLQSRDSRRVFWSFFWQCSSADKDVWRQLDINYSHFCTTWGLS